MPAAHDVVADGRVRGGILRAWPRVVAQLGADADALLGEIGIARAFFDDEENVLSYLDGSRLLQRSVEMTGVRHFGLLIGQANTLSALGAVGFLMRASPTVGHALAILAEYFRVHDQGGQVAAEARGQIAMLSYRIKAPVAQAVDQIYMLAAASACNFLRELRAPDWRPIEVQLPFRRPADVRPLQDVLAARLAFNAEQMNVVFPASDLAKPVATADPVLYRMMAERVSLLESRLSQDLVQRVRDLLQTLIFLPEASGAVVANRIGLSLRTLKRRLQERGTSLQAIRDDVRAEAACQLLQHTDKSAGDIAFILGYAEASAFTRAFRRWRGVPPLLWRASRASSRRPG